MGRALTRAATAPPAVKIVPSSRLDGYSGTPLPKKLGIKPGSVVALCAAPDGFDAVLGALPEGAVLRSRMGGRIDLAVWFIRSLGELERTIDRIAKTVPAGGAWIAWPKKTSRMASDINEAAVREAGLSTGLVDYKVCAIDADWSGLKFARRK